MTRLRLAMAAAAAVLGASAPGAQDLRSLAPDLGPRLTRRWQASFRAQPGWLQPGFEAGGWVPARPVDRAAFPGGVVAQSGTTPRPLETGRADWLQYLFSPFWHPAPGGSEERVCFRREFDFTEAYDNCSTYVALENPYALYVNGTRVWLGRRDAAAAREHPLRQHLRPGRNVLALEAEPGPGSSAVVVWTDLHQAFPVRDGRPVGWLCSLRFSPGWEKPGFRPRDWKPAAPAAFSPHFGLLGRIDTQPVWHPGAAEEHSAAYFRLPLALEGVPNFGAVEIVADNAWELYVNGVLVGVERRHLNPAPVRLVEVGEHLRPGGNVVAVKAYNYGGPAALACLPRVKVSF